jgi:hypothetical protein
MVRDARKSALLTMRAAHLPPVAVLFLADMLDGNHVLVLGGVEHDHALVERPAMRMPSTGQRINWPLSVTSMIWSESSTGNDATSLPLRPFTDIRAISAKTGTKKPRTMPGLKICWRGEIRSVPRDDRATEAVIDARSDHIYVLTDRVGAEYAAGRDASQNAC